MSHFATALTELMDEKNLSQTELSKKSGLSQSQISRWVNADPGVKSSILDDEEFERLCKVFTKPIEQANLMRARLLDMLAGPDVPGTKLVQISISDALIQEESPAYKTKLPPKLDRDIQTVIEHLQSNRLIRDMISSLAAHLRRR